MSVGSTNDARQSDTGASKDQATVLITVPASMERFAGEVYMSPPMKVERILQALKAWRAADDSVVDAPDAGEVDEHAITCMLADLRHLCDEHELDFAQLDRQAYADYAESRGDEMAHAPAHHPGEKDDHR